jgi:hypothetical protein
MGKKPVYTALFFFLSISLSAQAGLRIVVEDNNGNLTIVSSQGKTKELIIPERINE